MSSTAQIAKPISMLDLIRAGVDETIRINRRMGEADDQYLTRNEEIAQRIFFPALATFRSAVLDAQAATDLSEVKDYMRKLLQALDDHAVTREQWNEALS